MPAPVWILLFALQPGLQPGPQPASPPPPRVVRLANGARVAVEERPHAGSFAIQATFLGGRCDDDVAGLSATLARVIQNDAAGIESSGARLQVLAGRIGIAVQVTGPAEAFLESAQAIAGVARDPAPGDEEIRKAAAAARAEALAARDLASTTRERTSLPLLLPGHCLGRVDHLAEDLPEIPPEAARRALRLRLVGRRLTVSMVGAVDLEAARPAFESLPAGEPAPALPAPAPLRSPRRARARRRTAQPELLVAIPTAGIPPQDEPAMDLLAHLLAGFDERLSLELRQRRGWAYWVSALDWRYGGAGLFGLLTAVPRRHLDEAEAIVRAELVRLARESPEEPEIERARRYLSTQRARTWQQSEARAAQIAAELLRGVTPRSLARIQADYEDVTPAQVRDLAARLLSWSEQAVITVR